MTDEELLALAEEYLVCPDTYDLERTGMLEVLRAAYEAGRVGGQ